MTGMKAQMALASMTGFARADGAAGGTRWSWELKSVNGKGLDIRLRLPPGFEALEPAARERIAANIGRGNCNANLTVKREVTAAAVRINEAALNAVIAAAESVAVRINAQPMSLDGLFAIRGIVDIVDEDDEDSLKALNDALLAGLAEAAANLAAARAEEGAALAAVLSARLDDIERLTRAAESCPARAPEAIRARLKEQIDRLMEAGKGFDDARLHQEAMLLAAKADIREELDRLYAHVEAARGLIATGGLVGRRLDFLAQEFNREANTLCSKSNDKALTAIGLDLKLAVDQLREQIQNVE